MERCRQAGGCDRSRCDPKGTEHEQLEAVAVPEPSIDLPESTSGKGTAEKGKGSCRGGNAAHARKKGPISSGQKKEESWACQ
jgi:hypothetical protein